MINASIPSNESDRLGALVAYKLVGLQDEGEYDEITSSAAELSGTPFAIISVIDDKRQWFVSKYGMEVEEAPRNCYFCTHAIFYPNQPFIVTDARFDKRFYNNRLVVGEPFVNFYAGVPILNPEGYPLGILAVMDNRPREISEHKISMLQLMAKNVALLFELRKANIQMEECRGNN